MNKKLIIGISLILALFVGNIANSLQVDETELKTDKIEFENYKGARRGSDTVRSIRTIGRRLARGARKKKYGEIFRYHMKYSILHAVSTKEDDKFSADIFSVDKQARVDHIKNIRRILSTYLEKMYGYSRKNADALAVFITYYNAVHRGDTEYFATKYKTIVINHINKKNAGIATRYFEWPGKTKMLIPLYAKKKKGEIDKIDPDIISDKDTIKKMREDDENIESRKDLVDIKEDIIDRDKKELEREKEEQRKKEAELRKKEEELEKNKNEEEKKKLEEEKARLEAERRETEEKEKELDEKEEKLKEEKSTILDDEITRDIEKDPDSAKEKLKEKEKELDEREDKLRQDQLHKNVYKDKFYYLKVGEYKSGGHYANDMYMIDPDKKQILFKSPVNNIAGSRYDIFASGVVVITKHKKKHRLTLLDIESLESINAGANNVFWRSFVVVRDNFIYVIIIDKDKYYLAKFDNSLRMVAQSDEEISEDTFITFYKDYVFINAKDKEIVVFNINDLTKNDTVKPQDANK